LLESKRLIPTWAGLGRGTVLVGKGTGSPECASV
jgi:hypothetical protein